MKRKRSVMEVALSPPPLLPFPKPLPRPLPETLPAGGPFNVETVSVRVGDVLVEVTPGAGEVIITCKAAKALNKKVLTVVVEPDKSGALRLRVPV